MYRYYSIIVINVKNVKGSSLENVRKKKNDNEITVYSLGTLSTKIIEIVYTILRNNVNCFRDYVVPVVRPARWSAESIADRGSWRRESHKTYWAATEWNWTHRFEVWPTAGNNHILLAYSRVQQATRITTTPERVPSGAARWEKTTRKKKKASGDGERRAYIYIYMYT